MDTNMNEESNQDSCSSPISTNLLSTSETLTPESSPIEAKQVSGEQITIEEETVEKENVSDSDNYLPETVSLETIANGKKNEESEQWLDIIGSGDFKKKILKPGKGVNSRPKRGDVVTVNLICCTSNGEEIEQKDGLQFVIGDLDVIQGLDLAVNLMELEEKAKILIPSRLAYGKLGRKPDIPPDCDLECDLELLAVKEIDETELSLTERLRIGNEKRNRGNFFYDRTEYINALHCYERASEYLDNISNTSDNSNEELQTALDVRIKIYNNMAATHLKLEAYDSALKSVEFVIKIQSKNVKAHFRKGKILAAKGLTDEAIVSMKIAANLEPDSKIIQQELVRLINKKKKEELSQKEMYKRMFGQDPSKSNSKKPSSFVKKWSLFAGGVLALAFSMVAYRQYHS